MGGVGREGQKGTGSVKLQFPADDVEVPDERLHSTRVDHLAQMRLNSLRSSVETLRIQFPGIGSVLASQVEALADALAAGGRAA
jgi:CRISPR/Cas system CMR-associated protein Cmr1 (group 7 of RAMP superfamily)